MPREMKDSGIEWIGEIPANWRVLRGKNCLTLLDRKPREEDSIITCFRDGVVTLRSKRREDGFTISEKETGYQGINKGDLVVHGMDGFAGAIGISDSNGKGTPILNVLDSHEDKKYLVYFLRSAALKGYFLATATGIRVRSCDLRWPKLAAMPFALPSRVEQTRIADYLDYKCSQIDSLVSNIEAQIVKLDEYKKALITQTVTKGLDPNVELKDSGVEWIGEIPKRWEIYNPKYLFKQQVARAKLGQKQLTASQKYGVISQKEFMNRENQSIVPVEKDFSILKQVVPGDFVISMRSFQGGLEYSDMEGSISSAYVMVHKTNDQVENRYYKWLFKSSCYIDALQPTSNLIRDGQAMRFTNFQLVRIPLPPIDEQKDIAVYLDQKCHQIDSLKDSLIQQKKSLSDYKKTLIFDYVTGKKEVPTSWDKERSDE